MEPLLALGGAALLATALLIPPIKRLAWRINLVDRPSAGTHKAHPHPTPYGGGVAIFAGLVLALAAGQHWLPELLSREILLLVGGGGVLLLLGLLDDWRGLPPLPRFALQFAVAGSLVALCPLYRLPVLPNAPPLATALSAVWLVAMANAFNFLDNMDGLSGGLAVIALLVLAVMGWWTGHPAAALTALALSGATAGFLFYNFPPASIFVGDAGGLFLGFMAGGLSTLLSHECPADPLFLAPLLVLLVPAYDLSSVVLIRLCRRLPPWRGDHNHLSHRLVRQGLSRRGAVLVIYALTLAAGLGALGALRSGEAWLVLLLLLLALAGAAFEFCARGRLLQSPPP
jgi:UDP-GlcNAc:undecaprenyl-phosphate GlcNAc-1-phosphate transferase